MYAAGGGQLLVCAMRRVTAGVWGPETCGGVTACHHAYHRIASNLAAASLTWPGSRPSLSSSCSLAFFRSSNHFRFDADRTCSSLVCAWRDEPHVSASQGLNWQQNVAGPENIAALRCGCS